MTIGERIKQQRESKGLSQRALAKLLSVEPNTLWRWEKGQRNPSDEDKRRIAEALHTSISYLIGETDDPSSAPSKAQKKPAQKEPEGDEAVLLGEDLRMVPLLGPEFAACCGEGNGYDTLLMDDISIETRIPVSLAEIGSLSPHAFAIRTEGDSMSPAGITPGTICVIDPAVDPHYGDVVLACINHHHRPTIMIRWWFPKPDGSIDLSPADPNYRVETIHKEDQDAGGLWVCGVVVAFQGRPKRGA